MTTTATRDDLAADLLADLGPEPSFEAASTRLARPVGPPSPLSGPIPRGPALTGTFRVQPLDWSGPKLQVERYSVAAQMGPVYLQVGLRAG